MGAGFAGRALAPESRALLLHTLCSSFHPGGPWEGGGWVQTSRGGRLGLGGGVVVLNMARLGDKLIGAVVALRAMRPHVS